MKVANILTGAVAALAVSTAAQATIIGTQAFSVSGPPSWFGQTSIGTASLDVAQYFKGATRYKSIDVELTGFYSLSTTLTATGGYGETGYPMGSTLLIEPSRLGGYFMLPENAGFSLSEGFGPVADGETVSKTIFKPISYSFTVFPEPGYDLGELSDTLNIDFFASGIDYEFTVESAQEDVKVDGLLIITGTVPEPGTIGLLLFGILGLGAVSVRRYGSAN